VIYVQAIDLRTLNIILWYNTKFEVDQEKHLKVYKIKKENLNLKKKILSRFKFLSTL
jgi:hypothetical protein